MGTDHNKSLPTGATELRQHAEERLGAKTAKPGALLTVEEAQRLVHELEVHRIELEMQNAELRRARDELEAALEKYTDLYDFAPAGFVTLDRNGVISAVNLAGACLLGGVRSLLIGRRFGLFVAAADRPTFTGFLDSVLASRIRESCEVTLLNKGHQPVIVQIEGMATASEQEFRLALIDITARKRLEAHLLQTRKMETVSLLAGGIAHDFNNILNVIVGYGAISKMNLKEGDPLQDNLDQIIAMADKGADLTGRLLNVSRQQPIELLPVDVNELIRHVETFLGRVIGEDIRFATACTTETLTVAADRGLLEEVVINLATNARHAMPDGGRLSIFTEAFAMDPEFIRLHGFGTSGNYARISVTDTGTGMDRETALKIFDPFFTTRNLGKGVGLGLSIVYGIISQHNGHIDVRSEPAKGTTFRIYLPLTDTAHTPEARVSPHPSSEGGTETILLAEDDEAVRSIAAKILSSFGYQVITAKDGADAVVKFMAHRDAVRLLLFDVLMPNMNGKDACDEIRRVCPEVRVLFMSGYTADILGEKALEMGTDIIMKPFSPLDLKIKVREMLDGTCIEIEGRKHALKSLYARGKQ